MEYEYLDTNKKRNEIKQIGYELSQYLHNKEIKNIIFIDNSARLGYIALIKSWRNLFPGEKIPNIYFTNPKGYNLWHRNSNEIIKEINSTYKKLNLDKNQKIMLFDACMHLGLTLNPIIKNFKKAGYNNIFIGLAQPRDKEYDNYKIEIDFNALTYKPESCCYPFGKDSLLEKESYSILSSKNMFKDKMKSNKLRKEISNLFYINSSPKSSNSSNLFNSSILSSLFSKFKSLK